ncbi:MAG: hypothetical protein EXR49_03720 [Dehalococcoidia bacterium]|nr:hypothetical protein [Dehalococcoidia bacterium]
MSMPRCSRRRKGERAGMTSTPSTSEPLVINVGLVGAGVVGSAVLDYFAAEPLEMYVPGARFGEPTVARVRLYSVARRSRGTGKGALPAYVESLVTRDGQGRPRFYYDSDGSGGGPGPAWRQVVHDDEVDIVVEVTGSPVAGAVIEEALWSGKCVVTANKTVISRSGYELVRLAQSRGAILAYEAAVGGGMPIVQTIASSIGGRVTAMLAIINGTTNFILTRMREAAERGGDSRAAYPAAVCAAIHSGLAESDPGADVLGQDAQSKIILLAGLAFGVRLRPKDVYARGIARRAVHQEPAGVDRAAYHDCPGGSPCGEMCGKDDHLGTAPVLHVPDLQVLERMGYVPKLLAGAQAIRNAQTGADERIVAWVQPAAVPVKHALAGVAGSQNACLLQVESPSREIAGPFGKPFEVLLRGPGAGGPETASSVMADVLFCARQIAAARRVVAAGEGPRASLYMYGSNAFGWEQAYEGTASMLASDALAAPFLLRFIAGARRANGIALALGRNGVEAAQVAGVRGQSDYLYFKTAAVSLRAVEAALEAVLKQQGASRMPLDVLYLPLLEGAAWEEAGRGA